MPPWGASARTAYYVVVYFVFQISFSCYYVPFTSVTMQLSPRSSERDSATAYRMFMEIVSILVAVSTQGVIISSYSDAQAKRAYVVAALVFGVVVLVCGSIVGFGVPQLGAQYEASAPIADDAITLGGDSATDALGRTGAPSGGNARKKLSFFRGFLFTVSSRSYMMLTMTYLTAWIAILLVQSNLILYFKYAVDLERQFQYLLIVLLVATFSFLPVWALLVRRIGKQYTLAIGLVWLMGPLIYLSLASSAIVPMYAAAVCSGVGLGVVYLVPWSMLPDVIDQVEIKSGQRHDSLFYSFFVFFQKLGAGLTLGMSTLALGLAGYRTPREGTGDGVQAGLDERQPRSVETTLRIMVGPVPCGLILLSLVFLWLYPLTHRVVAANQILLHGAEVTVGPPDSAETRPLLAGAQ